MSDDRYRVKLLTRCTIAGVRWRAGAVISIPGDKLRVAAHLIRTGAAKAADDRTRLAVELYEAVRQLGAVTA